MDPATCPSGIFASLYSAFRLSLCGIRFALKSERAFRQEAVLLVLALPTGLVAAPNMAWFVAMIGVLVLTLSIELLNTAIEKLADHVTTESHPNIASIKDLGSAAVFCSLMLAGMVWLAAIVFRLEGLMRAP